MNILWMGGEDIDFPNGASIGVVSTSTAQFRSGYARCALSSTGQAGVCKSTPFHGGAVTSLWLSFRFYYTTGGTVPSSKALIGVGSSANSAAGVYVAFNQNGTGTFSISTYDGTTFTVLASSALANSLSASTLGKMDVQLTYGTSGSAVIYLNGVQILSYSGSLSVAAVASLDTVFLRNVQDSGPGNTQSVSEIIVADSDTRSLSLLTAAPNGNGTTQSWSNPAYTNFNPISINDANATYSNTVGQDEQAALIDPPTGTFSVLGIKVAARAMATSGATPTGLKLGVNSGGTVAVNAAHTLSAAFTTYEDYFVTDPTTSASFTTASLTALQLDMRSA